MNRIQHICTPTGRPANLTLLKRLVLRLPAALMLARPLIQLYVAMCRDYRTPSAQNWLQYTRMIVPASSLSGTTDYTSLFWWTFIGACFTQSVAIAARSLEHVRSMDDPSTFNLVSFGFLLYIHSTNKTFVPDAHVYLIVISRVVELLGLNVLQMWRRPPLSRLAFTSMLGIIMTTHYVYTTMCTDEYPIVHSTSRFMEATTVAIIILTVCLHAITMLMTDGYVSFNKLKFTQANMPRPTDDYTIAVLKLGTACLHATRLTGYALELKALDMPLRTYVEMYADGRTVLQHGIADVEHMVTHGINGLGHEVRDVRVKLHDRPPELGSPVRGGDKVRESWAFAIALYEVVLHFFKVCITRLKPFMPRMPPLLLNIPRYVRLFWHGTNGEARREARIQAEREREAEQIQANQRVMSLRERYLRRRRMAEDTAHAPAAWDPDEDLDPIALISLATDTPESDRLAFQDMLLKHMMRPDHAPPLTRSEYRQLMLHTPSEKPRESTISTLSKSTKQNAWASTAALLALSSRADLAMAQSASDRNTQFALLRLLQERRVHSARQHLSEGDLARLCVVCCCEPRTIINWPCRCLALCDECREILATQQKTTVTRSSHGVLPVQLCPTCRTPVMGFSRMYLP